MTTKATTALNQKLFADLQSTDEVIGNDYAADGVTVVGTVRVPIGDLLRRAADFGRIRILDINTTIADFTTAPEYTVWIARSGGFGALLNDGVALANAQMVINLTGSTLTIQSNGTPVPDSSTIRIWGSAVVTYTGSTVSCTQTLIPLDSVTGLQAALDAKSATGHTHTALEISDSTSLGRDLLTAVTAAAARSSIAVDRSVGEINIRDFGAVGDGVTDDTAAIQAALNVGGNIRIPVGVFVHDTLTVIHDGTTLFGDGYNCVLKRVTRSGSVYNITINQKANVTLFHFRIDGNWANIESYTYTENELIEVDGSDDLTIDSMWIHGSGADAIDLDDTGAVPNTNTRITNCKIWNCAGNGIHGYRMIDCLIAGNVIWDIGRGWVGPTPAAPDAIDLISASVRSVVANNLLIDCLQGISIRRPAECDCIIIGNRVEDIDGFAIEVAAENVTVSNNQIRNAGNSDSTLGEWMPALKVTSVGTGALIVGNSIKEGNVGGIASIEARDVTLSGNNFNANEVNSTYKLRMPYELLDAMQRIHGTSFDDDMVLVFDTTRSAGTTVGITVRYDASVEEDGVIAWGDGTEEKVLNQGLKTHTYAAEGTYVVRIRGQLHGIGGDVAPDADQQAKLIELRSFGVHGFTDLRGLCRGAINLEVVPEKFFPASVTELIEFLRDTDIDPDLSGWDVSNVTVLSTFARDNPSFTGRGLPGWDTSSCTSLLWMFLNASSFQQPLGSWDISNVTSVSQMFTGSAMGNGGSGDASAAAVAAYDATLIGWAAQVVANSGPNNLDFHNNWNSQGRYSAAASSAVADLQAAGWTNLGTLQS